METFTVPSSEATAFTGAADRSPEIFAWETRQKSASSFSMAFSVSKCSPSAYIVISASSGWPRTFACRASSSAFVTTLRRARRFFHFSSYALSIYLSFSAGISAIWTDHSLSSRFGSACHTSSAVKQITGATSLTREVRISYMAVCALLLRRESSFSV